MSLPPGIVMLGLVFGLLYALIAAGIVLIYRANRVVNFSQAALGVVGAVLAIELSLRWHVPYLPAVLGGLAATALVAATVSLGIIRRLRDAPRLMVSVATIGVAQILEGLGLVIPHAIGGAQAMAFRTPFKASFSVHPVIFTGDHVAVLLAAPAAIAGIAWFLSRTDHGVALRAAAVDRDRASLLGVPVERLTTIAWVLAGLLSALAVLLRVPIVGFTSIASVSGGGSSLLLRTLAAAVIARMESLPRVVIASLLIGVFEQALAWNVNNGTVVDAVLVLVILAALLLQRDVFARGARSVASTWHAIRAVRPVPAELRSLPEVVWGRRALALTLLAFGFLWPVWAGPAAELIGALILIYAIVALSLVVLTGWAGHLSLGQFAIAGFGGAATSVLFGRHGWDLFMSLAAGIVVAALVALVIGLPALRVRGPFLAVTTLAFAVTSSTFLLEGRYVPWLIEERVQRPQLLGFVSLERDWQMYLFALVGFLGALAIVRRLRAGPTGRAIIAARDNPLAAEAAALSRTWIHLKAFLISGALAGFAGGLLVVHQHGLHTDVFTPEASLRIFSMVVIGGLGSIGGAALGAIYVRGAELLLPGGWSLLATGGGLLVLVLFLPDGLGGLVVRWRDAALRLVARRRGIVVPSLVGAPLEAGGELDAALGRLARASPPGRLDSPQRGGIV